VIDENAITRIIDPEVRTIQLNHLATMADRSNVTIQLIPTSAGLYAGAGEPFTHLGFDDPENATSSSWRRPSTTGCLRRKTNFVAICSDLSNCVRSHSPPRRAVTAS